MIKRHKEKGDEEGQTFTTYEALFKIVYILCLLIILCDIYYVPQFTNKDMEQKDVIC